MSAYKIQMPGNYSEESIQHLQLGKGLKSRILHCCQFQSKNLQYIWHFSQYLKECFAFILADPPNDVLQNPG
jgi:hypothetical protein